MHNTAKDIGNTQHNTIMSPIGAAEAENDNRLFNRDETTLNSPSLSPFHEASQNIKDT